MVQTGAGVKEKHAAKWEEALATDLYPGETVWAFTSIIRFKPQLEALAITDRRVMGFASFKKPGQKIRIDVDAASVRGVKIVETFAARKLHVLTDGVPEYFGEVKGDDIDLIRYYVDHLMRRSAAGQSLGPVVVASAPDDSTPKVSLIKPTTADSPEQTSLSDEIARLIDMRRQGWLTEAEFIAAKQAVIRQS